MSKIFILAKTILDRPDLRKIIAARLQRHELYFGETDANASQCATADGLVIGRETVDAPFLSKWTNVRAIAKYGVGLDNIDLTLLAQRNVTLLRQDGINSTSVAEFAVGLMLSLSRNICATDHLLRQGQWHKDGGALLSHKTIGIIGCGAIGSKVASILKHGFNCKLLLHDIIDKSALAKQVDGRLVPLQECLQAADMVTLHVPYDQSSHHLLGWEQLRLMQRHAGLINTSRGGVVDESALKRSLAEGIIAGMAFDVFAKEPLSDLDFYQHKNVICTPHIAGNARETVQAMVEDCGRQLDAYFI